MSVDYDAVCDACEQTIHCGQDMGGRCSFGRGSSDEEGRMLVAAWVFAHASHGTVRIEVSDVGGYRVSDGYKQVDLWFID